MMRNVVAIAAVLTVLGTPGVGRLSAQVPDSGAVHVAAVRRAWVPASTSRAQPLQHPISLDLSGVRLVDALEKISQRAGLRLGYGSEVRRSKVYVSLKSDSLTVLSALLQVLEGTGFQPYVSVRGDAVLVSAAAPAPRPAPGSVVGRVTDAKTGRGVSAADVFLESTRWKTVTDTAGRYVLADVDAGTYTLVTRRFGYVKQSRQVVVKADRRDTLDLALEPAPIPLTDLVATATGLQRRRDIGNAITTLQVDSLMQNAPVHSLTDLLEGRVPGMTMQHTSGAPGDPAKVRLRGIGSLLRSNDPVVVVDGFRVNSDQSSARAGNLANLDVKPGNKNPLAAVGVSNPAPSPLDQIDPNTIEKVEVFKGPAAATLYGADAANGVIVITTKKGKPGPTQWNASITHSRSTKPGDYPTAYFRWGHLVNEGGDLAFCPLTVTSCVADSLVKFQALNDPNLTVLGAGRSTDLSLTASGGSQTLTYRVTGSYGDELGQLKLPQFEIDRFRQTYNREPDDWMVRPHDYKTWGVTSNVTARLGATADVTLSANVFNSDQRRSTLENEIGTLQGAYISSTLGCCWLPSRANGQLSLQFADPLNGYYTKTTAGRLTFSTGLNATWRPRSWINAMGRAGVEVEPRDDQVLLPTGLPLQGTVADTFAGAVSVGTGTTKIGTFEVGSMVQKRMPWGLTFQTSVGANLTTRDESDVHLDGAGLVEGTTSVTGARFIGGSNSRFSSSVYGWYIEPRVTGQRISLSTGFRLDGGSNYGTRISGGLVGLPKLNGSWVISEEPWFPFSSLFSSLRLRGAYGQAQVQPGPTDRLRTYKNRNDPVGGPVLDLLSLGNAELRPERSTEVEGGFDADLFNSRATVEFTAYRKNQVDALLSIQLPGSAAGPDQHVFKNIGNIRNTGLEVTASIRPLQTRTAAWSVSLNYSRGNNILTKLGPGVDEDRTLGNVVGYPVGGRWAKPILGYFDANNDHVISRDEVLIGDTLVYMGRLQPAYTSSLSTNLELFGRAVQIAADFFYDGGQTQIDANARANWVLSPALVDPSTPLSQQAAVMALGSLPIANIADSTDYGLMQAVSTFRFQSVSVSYNVPKPVARLLHAQDLRISLRGRNLGMHSTYRGKDPDVNAWSPGEGIIDTGQLAQPRVWELAAFMRF